jgi:hypothetical protein
MTRRSVATWSLLALLVVIGIYLLISTCPDRTGIGLFAGRGQGFVDALVPYRKMGDPRSSVGSTLISNYQEDRSFGQTKADG